MTEHEAYVAFALAANVGSVSVAKLKETYGSVAAAWERFDQKVSWTGEAVDYRRELDCAEKREVAVVTPADDDYPSILLETTHYPLAIYVKGNVKALAKKALAMVGTRRATALGLANAETLAADLSRLGWSIVSGLALGIDASAHRGALSAEGVTVGVLGSALDRFYPEENIPLAREIVEKGGAVVSEFPFGRASDAHTFPQRNCTVAALTLGVIAVEAPPRSGTLITTRCAADLGRTVMALPARIGDRMSGGNLQLIRDGARLVRGAEDVMEEMSFLAPHPTARRVSSAPRPVEDVQPITLEEASILKRVSPEGTSIDRLIEETEFSPVKVSALCMALRIKGRLRHLPGNRVSLAGGR